MIACVGPARIAMKPYDQLVLDEGHIEDILMVATALMFYCVWCLQYEKGDVWTFYFLDRDISRNLMLKSILDRTTIFQLVIDHKEGC